MPLAVTATRREKSGVIKIPPDIIGRQRRDGNRTYTLGGAQGGRHGRGEKKKSRRAAKKARVSPSLTRKERERERERERV